jgi:hypothetical protein
MIIELKKLIPSLIPALAAFLVLCKESAITVMVAVMLGAASLLGALQVLLAMATHYSVAAEVARNDVTQSSGGR